MYSLLGKSLLHGGALQFAPVKSLAKEVLKQELPLYKTIKFLHLPNNRAKCRHYGILESFSLENDIPMEVLIFNCLCRAQKLLP